jgi:hypothetical protein
MFACWSVGTLTFLVQQLVRARARSGYLYMDRCAHSTLPHVTLTCELSMSTPKSSILTRKQGSNPLWELLEMQRLFVSASA